MQEKISEKKVTELKNLNGKVKGSVLYAFLDYVYQKEGDKGLNKLKQEVKDTGTLVNFNKIDDESWIKEGVYALFLIKANSIFNWSEEDVFNLGEQIFRISFLDKIVLNHFTSFKKALDVIPQYWEKHYGFGKISIVLYSTEEKYVVIRREGEKTSPLLCLQHRGYLTAKVKEAFKSSDVVVEKTKSMDEKEVSEDYKVTWQ